ncbi:MAG: 4Fe-4S dicluster domain-containing protein [Atopobiaceae bacterium]|jgi:ferredoxin
MAEGNNRDVLDDIIDIQRDIGAVKNPLNGVANQLIADPSKVPHYNASDYKDRPRANSISCLRSAAGRSDVCGTCLDVCPVDAISFVGSSVKIADNCRKCGLCIAACPTEVFLAQRQMARRLYDNIVRAANIYNECYITCTRALGRLPKDNEILLPCIGVMPRELWFALLADYGNISVYLPLGICDKCRTTTGEKAFSEAIAEAESQSPHNVGLEVDEKNLTHEESRAYKRKQFMSSMAQAGTQIVTRKTPVLAGAQAVAQRLQKHTKQINSLQHALEQMTGNKNAQSRRRLLTQKRKLELTALQSHPDLAAHMQWQIPACDMTKCTMCGDCVRACVQHACQLDEAGHFSVETAYCINCSACVVSCPEEALTMVAADPQDMIVPDPNAKKLEEQKAQAELAKKKGKKAFESGAKALGVFAQELGKEYGRK